MRKPVFQGVLGVSILVSAVSLGVMLTRYISLRAYAPKAAPKSAPAPSARPAPAPAPETWKNLFAPSAGMTLPSKLPAVASGGAAVARSNFALIGTIVSSRPGDSRAVLWADGMKEPKVVRINTDVEPGAVLTYVSRDQARISRGGETEQLDLLPVGSKGRTVAPAAPPPAAGRSAAPPPSAGAPGGNDIRVERLAENAFALNEADVAHLAGNINQYMTQIRMVPYFEANKSAGYRIAAIRPGTTFEKLGFQGGDVLQQVNGVALSSPENLYTIFQNLKDEKQLTVDIIRRGQKSTLKYEIR
ncbi:MAG: type II secretion system protein GspC [Thermodesulfobacteriota bacterium]